MIYIRCYGLNTEAWGQSRADGATACVKPSANSPAKWLHSSVVKSKLSCGCTHMNGRDFYTHFCTHAPPRCKPGGVTVYTQVT